MASEPSNSIACPRCGYDQRGIMLVWSEFCPLQSTCAECGLEIQWAEMLSTKLKRPGWCVEYAASKTDFLRRGLRTVLIAFVPWKLWKSLRMIDPPRWRRLAALVGVVVCGAAVAYYVVSQVNGALSFRDSILKNYTTKVDIVDVSWRAIVTPFSKTSPGIMTQVSGRFAGRGIVPYPPPADWTVNAYGGIRFSWRAAGESLAGCGVGLLMLLFCPLAFVALPISRRRAKVRWAHLWRVMMYSLWWLIPPVAIMVFGHLELGWNYQAAFVWLEWATAMGLLILPLAAIFFWQAALRHYLRMGQSVGVAIAVVIMSWLAANAVMFYCLNPMTPSEMIELIKRAFQ